MWARTVTDNVRFHIFVLIVCGVQLWSRNSVKMYKCTLFSQSHERITAAKSLRLEPSVGCYLNNKADCNKRHVFSWL